eukprot:185233_1
MIRIRAQSKTHGLRKDNRFAIILLGLVCVATFAIVAYIITTDKTTANGTLKFGQIRSSSEFESSSDDVFPKENLDVDQNGKPIVIANPAPWYTPTRYHFHNFVKEVLNANGLEVPTGCRSKGSKPEGDRYYTGPTTLYTACRIQCSAGSFLTKPPSRNSSRRSPFNDELLVGFHRNGALNAYTVVHNKVSDRKWGSQNIHDVHSWNKVDFNKFKCARMTDTRVEHIDVPTKRKHTTDCISLAYVQETLHGGFEQTLLGHYRAVPNVYKRWICPNEGPEPLSYKLEISFDYGASYHIIGGFVGFRDNTHRYSDDNESKDFLSTWISEPFYLPVSGDANHRLNLVRGYARKHFTNNVVPDDINKLISTYVSTTDVTTALKQLDEVHARLVAKHKEAKVFKIKK